MDPIALRVAARYKGKKTTEEGNTVYLYSERQVARRNNEKAKRLEGLRSNIDKVRSQVKKDLKSKDPETLLTALVVALIDETFERVGNDESADDGHFGVTGWLKKHVTFSGGKATIQYVGKSGVKQKKTVKNKEVVDALKSAYDGSSGASIFDSGEVKVNAAKVNAYLEKFDVTAKDLRGFHANQEMHDRLRAERKGKLPEDKKEREKQLKDEFKAALEATAKAVGHEPSTLKSQYLVPGLEEQFLKDGTVSDKMVKKAMEGHYNEACSACGTIVSQCRCMGEHPVRLVGPENCPTCNPGQAEAKYEMLVKEVANRWIQAATIDKSVVERWRKDVRLLTKIYRDIPDDLAWDATPAEKAKFQEHWDEAVKVFLTFGNNFETWVYKVLLPKVDKESMGWLHKMVMEAAWSFKHELRVYGLFPVHHATKEPDLSKFRHEREKAIRRYQGTAVKAFDAIEDYLKNQGGAVERRDAIEHVEVGGVQVVIENWGRRDDPELEGHFHKSMNLLRQRIDAIKQAGFPGAVRGLTVTMSFDQKEWDTNGKYTPSTDTLNIYPIGLYGPDTGHGTFTHEVGHRFYFRELPGQARAHWEETLNARGLEITREDVERFTAAVLRKAGPSGHGGLYGQEEILEAALPAARDDSDVAKFKEMSRLPLQSFSDNSPFKPQAYIDFVMTKVGEIVQLEEITDYANTNPMEAFADCFKLWVLKGPGALKPWTRNFFREVCRAGGAKVATLVAHRFLHQ